MDYRLGFIDGSGTFARDRSPTIDRIDRAVADVNVT
jgi:hypothetical protein